MSWLYSQALVEAFSEASCSAGARSALWSETPTPQAFLSSDRTTDFCRLSRFGMTFGHLTDDLGADLLTWFRAGFHARHTALHLEDELWLTISGRKCGESWQMQLPGTYLPKTSALRPLKTPRKTFARWVTRPAWWPVRRATWVLTTFGSDIGYLHTPTTIANFCAPSMQKHRSCRAWVTVFGSVTPSACEYLMGWPLGWTDLQPLATDKYRNAQPQPGSCSHSEAA